MTRTVVIQRIESLTDDEFERVAPYLQADLDAADAADRNEDTYSLQRAVTLGRESAARYGPSGPAPWTCSAFVPFRADQNQPRKFAPRKKTCPEIRASCNVSRMVELSVQVQNKLSVADKVVASARTHGPKVAAIIAERAKAVQGPATKATVEAIEAVIFAIVDGVVHANTELRATELNYFREKADDPPIKAARDLAVTSVANVLAQLRTAIEATLGAPAAAQYGIVGDIPRTPHKLVTYTTNVVAQLITNPQQVTTAFGASFHTAPAATAVKASLDALDKLVNDDNRETRELEEAQTARNRAVNAWSDAYQGAASILEGLYRTAGYAELAEKVRPTQRKLRGEDPGDDINAPPTTSTSSDGT